MTDETAVPQPSSIYEAISIAKSRIGVIGKSDRNKDQDYAFRGIDSILNRAGPILTELGVVISPKHRVVSDVEVTSRNGARGYRVVIETKWKFAVSLESSVRCQTIGEAIDYSDKAFNKAQTQSFKNALAQVLSIPTGEADPDSESPERGRDETSAESVLRLLTDVHGFEPERARSYARLSMESLSIEHPLPNTRVEEVVNEAVRLREQDEAPFEKAELPGSVPDDPEDPDDPSSGYG